jgi:putative multiple sugar transport system substrate-binding protein
MKLRTKRASWRQALAVTAAGALVLTGCSQDEGTGAGPEAGGAGGFDTGSVIGVALEEGGQSEAQMFAQQLEESNFEAQVQTAADPAEQVEQLTKMIEGDMEVLIVDAVDPAGLGEQLEAAKAKGVPIIAYQTLVTGTDAADYFVSGDAFEAGAGQAQALLDGLGERHGKGPYNVELFSGDAGDGVARRAFDGAMSVLQPAIDNGTVAVASGQTSFEDTATKGAAPDEAKKRLDGLLGDTYKSKDLQGVLAVDDAVAQAVLGAAGSGRPDIVVVGGGSAAEAVESIMKDEQYATTYTDPTALISQAVSIVRRLSQDDQPAADDPESYDNGEEAVPAFLAKVETVTRENAPDVYAEDPELSKLAK